MEEQIILKMPENEYRATPGYNQSWLKTLLRGGLSQANTRVKPNKVMEIGTYAHCAILEPERFGEEYVRALDHDRRSKTNKKKWGEFDCVNRGKKVLKPKQYDRIISMQEAAQKHPELGPILKKGYPEVSVFWKDPHSGLDCKGRMDWFDPEAQVIMDLKTVESASLERIPAYFSYMGLQFQAAFYRDGVEVVEGKSFRFIFAFIERNNDHRVTIVEVEPDVFTKGQLLYRTSLDKVIDLGKPEGSYTMST